MVLLLAPTNVVASNYALENLLGDYDASNMKDSFSVNSYFKFHWSALL